MRFIPINSLKPGQKLALDLTLSENTFLLRKGISLTPSLIRKAAKLGFQGVYIDDELSRDIVIEDPISPELRANTKKELQTFFNSAKNSFASKAKTQIKVLKTLTQNIVDELSQNKNVMVNVIDLRTYDDYTYSHSLNVAVLSIIVGMALGFKKETINELAISALIHDIGKMFVDKKILNKPARLTPDEFEHIKKHSKLGFDYLCDNFELSGESMLAALQHHEQYNGNGYPDKLSGEDIHIFSRIVCVADVYDALTSDRPYRKGMFPSDAIEYIMCGYNTMFDPDMVKTFTKKVLPYPIGTCLKLSTGDNCIVVQNNESAILRPIIRLIANGKPTKKYIDLSNDRSALNITIKEVVNLQESS